MTQALQHAGELDRVRANTWPEVNKRLDQATKQRLEFYGDAGEEQLTGRLRKLNREWDFERVLEAEASTMGIAGLVLGITVDRRFLFLPGIVASMVLLHALQGWYPLLPLFRRLGVRSQDEIDRERYALKSLRGDLAGVSHATGNGSKRAAEAWRAVLA